MGEGFDKGWQGWGRARHRQFINQVVEWVLPESTSADEVSCTVKAFMASELIYVY